MMNFDRLGCPIAALTLAGLCGMLGCSGPREPLEVGSGDALDRLIDSRKVVALLVTETSTTRPSPPELLAFREVAASKTLPAHVRPAVLDLSHSHARAAAIPFRAAVPPVLMVTSPEGIILSRDDKGLTSELIVRRLAEGQDAAASADARYQGLLQNVKRSGTTADQRKLADFLIEHGNHREAIPHLQAVAADAGQDPSSRIAATVDLCRSHLWVGEPEKSRHTAQMLEAGLGKTSSEAVAAANLIFATQDITARRPARARVQLEKAITASPNSSYGQQAATMLQGLPATSALPATSP